MTTDIKDNKICECGHKEWLHGVKERPCDVMYCKCKQFKPKDNLLEREKKIDKNFEDALQGKFKPQINNIRNHSPSRILSAEDTEPASLNSRTTDVKAGSHNQTLSDKIDSSRCFGLARKVIPTNDVKSAVKKLKDELCLGECRLTYYDKNEFCPNCNKIDKIFGKELI